MSGVHFRNASWSGLAAAIRAATGLLSALLAVRLLGTVSYGHVATWLSLFVLYLSLNSSVFTMAVVRLVANQEGEKIHVNEIATSALRFCLSSVFLLAMLTIGLNILIQQQVLGGSNLPEGFSNVILLMGLLTSFQVYVALQSALIEGSGRLDLANKWQLIGPLFTLTVLTVGFLGEFSVEPQSYLAVLCIASSIDITALWVVRRTLGLPHMLFGLQSENTCSILQLLRSGGLLQATSLLNMFLEPVNKFLLNHFTGAAAVTIYDLAMKVVWGIQHLVGAAMRVFLHIGSQDRQSVGPTFVRAITLLSVPVVCMHTAGAAFLFWTSRYWLNIDGTNLMIFFGIATVSNLGMIFVTPLYMSLIGRHDLVFVFRTQVVLALVNVTVSGAMIPAFGLIGAAFGLLAATTFNAVAIYLRCQIHTADYRDYEIPMYRFKRRILVAMSLLALTIAWAISGGGELLVLACILAGTGLLIAGEPLIARIIRQFTPGST